MNYLHILCEGKSELVFASYVLSSYLIMKGIQVIPQALITNRRLQAKGGMIDFAQVRRDLGNMMKQFVDDNTDRHLFTTMFDLYALPTDFPGFEQAQGLKDYDQVANLEKDFLFIFTARISYLIYNFMSLRLWSCVMFQSS